MYILQGAPIELRLGFVDLDFECSTVTAKADGNLAEAAGQLGKMVEHINQNQPNSLRGHGMPCRESQAKTRVVFQAKTQAKIFLLN